MVQILGASKPGQWTGKVLNKVLEWQLGHPSLSKEDCIQWLKEEQAVGKISITDNFGNVEKKK